VGGIAIFCFIRGGISGGSAAKESLFSCACRAAFFARRATRPDSSSSGVVSRMAEEADLFHPRR
jgi:hypothetical protein